MYAEIIPNTRLPKNFSVFDYEVPLILKKTISPGHLVSVPFKKRLITGVVLRLKNTSPVPKARLKKIVAIKEAGAVIPQSALNLILWTADYYRVSPATALQSAIPAFSAKSQKKTKNRRSTAPNEGGSILKQKISNEIKKQVDEFLKNAGVDATVIRYEDTEKKDEFLAHLALRAAANGKAIILAVPRINAAEHLKNLILSFNPKARVASLHHRVRKSIFLQNWLDIAAGRTQIILGTKWAVFAPAAKLGFVIVDDEESPDHKQEDRNPKIDARSLAAKRAADEKIPIVLTTQAPRLETYAEIKNGRAKLITLQSGRQTQENKIIYLDSAAFAKTELLSIPLFIAVNDSLQNQKKALLFVNRRGAGYLIRCGDCRHLLECPHCGAALVAHGENLKCHHCGFSEIAPPFCPKCSGTRLTFWGAGTEKLERDLQKNFPQAVIKRIDSDTKFDSAELKNADIIIGTQLLYQAIEHQVKNLSIGVIVLALADTFLNQPDFHAAEKTFQWLVKLKNLAATADCPFLAQTFIEEALPIKAGMSGDFEQFYENELKERHTLQYPPFWRLIKISGAGATEAHIKKEAEKIKNVLEPLIQNVGGKIVGPASAWPPKKRGQYMYNLIIKLQNVNDDLLSRIINTIPENWIINMEPQNLS